MPLANALERKLGSIHGRHDVDVQILSIVFLQIHLNFLDQLSIVGAVLVEPEYCRGVGRASTTYGELHPIADRTILNLAHAEDIAFFYFLFKQNFFVGVDDHNATFTRCQEGFIVGTVFLGFLRHQTNVRYAAHGAWIVGAIYLTVVDYCLINTCVAAIGNKRLGIMKNTIRPPHHAGITNHRRHRSINNDVARYVKVGNSLIRINHSEFRTLFVARLDISNDFVLLGLT